jgi:hypothetical protein
VFAGDVLDPQQVEAGFPIGIGVEPSNNCPKIVQETCSSGDLEKFENDGQESSICYFVHTWMDEQTTPIGFVLPMGWAGRSYAFEGEMIGFRVVVEDKDGIIDDCVKVAVTLDNGEDPIKAGCTLDHTEPLYDKSTNPWTVINAQGVGIFSCAYTVEAAEYVQGEYWISVQTSDRTCSAEGGCTSQAAGVISLYLNPEVSLTLSAQDQMGFLYNVDGTPMEPITAGSTVYSPYFTIENTADPETGLYVLLKLYGTDMKSGSAMAKCPTTNVLDIGNVEYKASHLNAQQLWTVMPDGTYDADHASYVFTESYNAGANFIGVGDDVTMRLRLHIPSPCIGSYTQGGKIVFIGQVI